MANEYTTVTVDMTKVNNTTENGTLTIYWYRPFVLANGDTIAPKPQGQAFTVTAGAASISLAATDTATAISGGELSYLAKYTDADGKVHTLGAFQVPTSIAAVDFGDLLTAGVTTSSDRDDVDGFGYVGTTTALSQQRNAADGAYMFVKDYGYYYRDEDSIDTPDNVSVVASVDGGNWLLDGTGRNLSPFINVKAKGARGDDSTNDTDILQAILADAADGSTIFFPAGTYRITEQLTWSGKRLTLVGYGATIKEQTAITGTDADGAMLYLNGSGCNGSSVVGLRFSGVETLAGFSGASTKDYCAIRVGTGTNVTIRDCYVTGKSYGVVLDACTTCRVIDLTMVGLFAVVTPWAPSTAYSVGAVVAVNGKLYTATVAGTTSTTSPTHSSSTATDGGVTWSFTADSQNYSSAAFIDGGTRNQVRGLQASHVGSGVLVGLDSTRNIISECTVENAVDNGIYLSSGDASTVSNCKVYTSSGSGIKARGSNHVIKGCTVKNCVLGYTLSGNGSTADAYGCNGHNTVLDTCIADTCSQDGVYIPTQDTYPARNFTVTNCQLINTVTHGGAQSAIRVGGGDYHTFSNNQIITCGASLYGISMVGTSGDHIKDCRVIGNFVMDMTTASATGIRLQYNDRTIVQGNTVIDANNGIDFRNSTDCLMHGNIASDAVTTGLVCNNTNTTCSVKNNKGVHSVDKATNYYQSDTVLYATSALNPSSLADGAGETLTITVTGAALGDMAVAMASYDLQGITVTAYVSAADTVKIRLQNETGGTIDLANGTWYAKVFKTA